MIEDEVQARAYVAEWCDAAAMARLERFVAMLAEESENQNLVARATLGSLWRRHIADSAQLLRFVPRETPGGVWLDLGTGAGFPGLVIAAMRPDWPVRLVESRRLRIEWLTHCCEKLGLDSCTVLGARVERLDGMQASVISARAFAPLVDLMNLSERFSTVGTIWLLPKGRKAAQELAALKAKRRAMFHVEQSLTDPDAGILVGRMMQEEAKPRP